MKNLLVVFGGKSFEHDISIITTLLIAGGEKDSNYNFLFVYISGNNKWFFVDKKLMKSSTFKNFEKFEPRLKKAFLKVGESKLFVKSLLKTKAYKIDAVLNCCHGGIGENGALVGLFECCGVPVSSFGQSGMGICMNKLLTKFALRGIGLNTIDFTFFSKSEAEKNLDEVASKIEQLGYPVILKPCNLGSSIGIEVAKNREELLHAISVALEFDNEVLVEKALLDMEEYNVACMKFKGKTIVSCVDKPTRKDEILSFEDKYIGSKKEGGKAKLKGGAYTLKKEFASINKKLEKRLKDSAKKAYESLGLGGVVRVDFIESKNEVYVNELNTVPGSLGYYFFCPSVFKTMGEFVDALADESILQKQNQAVVNSELVTKIF